MPALRKKRERRPEAEFLKGVDKQLRKVQRRKRYEEFTNVPPEWAIDAAKRLPSDDARRDAAAEIRDQADSADDLDRAARLAQVSDAIEAMCRPDDLESFEVEADIRLVASTDDWHEARRRYAIILSQIEVVAPADGVWILHANIGHLRNKEGQAEVDKALLTLLNQLYCEIYGPIEYKEYKRTGVNPWEANTGGRIGSRARKADNDLDRLDHTKAGKKTRAKALATVRHLDPTGMSIATVKERDKARAVGWERFQDGGRATPLDRQGSDRKRRAEDRQTAAAARQARRERKWGIGEEIKKDYFKTLTLQLIGKSVC